jgi:hypothetical protein
MFLGHFISQIGSIPWPACSADLTASDIFLWGYLNSVVHAAYPDSIQEMKVQQQHTERHRDKLEQVIFTSTLILNCNHHASYALKCFTSFVV